MHERIYRYQLPICDSPRLALPRGARVLSVAPERHFDQQIGELNLDLWVTVDPDQPPEAREFEVLGTGRTLPEGWAAELTFLGTVQTHGGALVWHVFEVAHDA